MLETMNKLTKEELSEVLIDVRKSYRLLYFYQRRILDTIKFISNFIPGGKIGGYALFSNQSPKAGPIDLTGWAWDWLNMYMYEFYFFESNTNEIDTLNFGIAIQSDTGFFDSTGGISASDVSFYSDVKDSATRFLFYIGKNTWKSSPFSNGELDFFKKSNIEYIEHSDKKIFLAKAYNLEELIDEDNILACLKDFKSFCDANGIPEFQLSFDNTTKI